MSTCETSVVIRCDSSPQLGMGHEIRCLTLAMALRDRGVAVSFVTTGLQSEARGFVVDPAPVHSRDIKRLPQEDSDALIAVARRTSASKVLIDHYGADEQYFSELKNASLRIGIIDNIADRNLLAADWLLNQNIGADCLEVRAREDCEMLLRSSLRPAATAVPQSARWAKQEIRRWGLPCAHNAWRR